jgi:hypothetical protein
LIERRPDERKDILVGDVLLAGYRFAILVICEERRDEAIHSCFAALWMASRSLSSGARSRDPLARNAVCCKTHFLSA